jgi:diketogulonate reductase-like aldo/keto reductase
MEKLAGPKGMTRFIGISNFSPKQVDDILKIATIKPKVHQIELHPYLNQDAFVNSLHSKGIAVTAYTPLGNTNPQWRATGSGAPQLLTNPAIGSVARARGCTPAQVVLAWNMKRNVVVIPKAANVQHQRENIATVDKCKLLDEDMLKIKAVDIPLRMCMSPCQPLKNACFEGLAASGTS